ncbi:hypothetical protein U4E84_12840 [Halorubrum sp. AD140]|uniref:hypothetical protein n=1 Tax=Halorubrum sp. AD140 TaxID=3050073 RepID=UPI002ACCC4FF|nr:hypothetical protein [Halorubrum sp. AD140]MDZ5812229.1 hypothetical protein [Halorubrum sp. AD140]
MRRRTVLATTGLALVGTTSGCQSGAETSPPPEDVRVTDMRYRNADRRPYRLHVLLLEDGEPVYWTAEDVPPAETQGDGELLVRERAFEEYPTDPARYELHARLSGDPRSEWVSTDFREVDSVAGDPEYRCFDVVLGIRDGELHLLRSGEWPDDTDSC